MILRALALLLVWGSVAAADPLTTPITQTITQYQLDAIYVDVQNKTVTVRVSLRDATGEVVRLHTFTEPTASLITPAQLDGLSARIVTFLKARGTLN